MLQILVTLLQFQCGSQGWGGLTLSYGSLVYLDDKGKVPQVIFFKEYESQYRAHPFCPILDSSLKGSGRLLLTINPETNELINVGASQK